MTKAEIKVYPIKCELSNPRGAIEVNILKISGQGMLINSLDRTLKVNETFRAKFSLPLKNLDLEVTSLVVKTYDKFKGQHGAERVGDHISELAFKDLTMEHRRALSAWIGMLSANRI